MELRNFDHAVKFIRSVCNELVEPSRRIERHIVIGNNNFCLDALLRSQDTDSRQGGIEVKANILIATLLVAATGVHVQAATRPHSDTLRVETPENYPVLAEENAQAIYLHKTADGSAFLYIELHGGRGLTVLDVTDPAHVKRIGEISLPTSSPFVFVRDINDNTALIRFSNGSGFALLNFRNSSHPVEQTTPELAEATYFEKIGETSMLTATAEKTGIPAGYPMTYNVLDIAKASGPGLLATIPAVTQRAENTETGTLFLLNGDGVTMVRRLRVEAEHQIELTQARGN
jgi:hypothetical protein